VVQPDGRLHGANNGGAARAILAALLDEGVPELRLANRARERAEARPAFNAWFGVMPEITPEPRAAVQATF